MSNPISAFRQLSLPFRVLGRACYSYITSKRTERFTSMDDQYQDQPKDTDPSSEEEHTEHEQRERSDRLNRLMGAKDKAEKEAEESRGRKLNVFLITIARIVSIISDAKAPENTVKKYLPLEKKAGRMKSGYSVIARMN